MAMVVSGRYRVRYRAARPRRVAPRRHAVRMATTSSSAPLVGLIGYGRMGSALAGRLLLAGYDVVVHDIDSRCVEAARTAECKVAGGAADLLGQGPSIVLLSLPTAGAFRRCVSDLSAGIDQRSITRLTVVDISTLDLSTKEEGRASLEAGGAALVDCPVSGIASQAAAGDVVLFASGAEEDLDRCESVLRAMSRQVFRVGAFGMGSRTKFLANLLVGIHNAAAAEMLAAAALAGLDPRLTLEAVASGAGGSRMLDVRGPQMVAGCYGDGATIELFRKDLGIITAFTTGIGARNPLLNAVRILYDEAAERGLGLAEPAAVFEVYREGEA